MIYATVFIIIQSFGSLSCDPAYVAAFTPARPELGRYEVCTSPKPVSELIQEAGGAWKSQTAAPLDAFGAAGAYDRAALSRLYGGRRVEVARGWIEENGQLVSLTFISPYPDPTLTRLNPGTLVIRFIICCT
jgi:hypothetical protein